MKSFLMTTLAFVILVVFFFGLTVLADQNDVKVKESFFTLCNSSRFSSDQCEVLWAVHR
jgi:hypothetical protein